MKKGTLTFERPFQTKSPDSLRRCQRINQNRVPIPVEVAKGYTPGKKNLQACLERSLSASSPCTRMLSSWTEARIFDKKSWFKPI